MVEQLAIQAHAVRHLVENVILTNRLANGEIEFRTETIPMGQLAESVAQEWTVTHGALAAVSGSAEAVGDSKWVAHAIRNALEDARSRGGQDLDIRISEGYTKVTVEILDNGAAIPADELKAFETRQTANWNGSVLSVGAVVARDLLKGMGGGIRLLRIDDINTCELSLHRSQERSLDRRRQMPIRAVAARHDMPSPADILAVLHDGRISMVYQSIVDLRSPDIATPQVIGYEALARFPNGSPPDWFKLAGSAGVGTDLELLALRAGIEGFVTNDQHTVLALNLSNSALLSPRLIQALGGIDPGRVVLELSDTARIHSYEVTRRAVDGLRERGIRLAVDDVGAGEIDMWHILRLNPDLLKLDRHLVADQDNVRRNNALIRGLATMASDLGILVIAEAIETEAERLRLLELGVEFGQGYLFGKPEPLQWKTRILGD